MRVNKILLPIPIVPKFVFICYKKIVMKIKLKLKTWKMIVCRINGNYMCVSVCVCMFMCKNINGMIVEMNFED